ncbi:zinc ribbon domain-containing protein, partial [Bacillus toyonensis]
KNMTLSDRVYSCICGINFDRDYNAAINIKNEAMRLLALA